jgi:hypothetical protein
MQKNHHDGRVEPIYSLQEKFLSLPGQYFLSSCGRSKGTQRFFKLGLAELAYFHQGSWSAGLH